MHKKLEHLVHLLENTTLGEWGPTTEPPRGKPEDEFHIVKDGERGEPTWGAIVSDQEGVPGVDHIRYAREDSTHSWYEPGTDIYGGTLIAESIANQYNGQFMAEAHNLMPNMILLINDLENLAKLTLGPSMAARMFENYLGPNE